LIGCAFAASVVLVALAPESSFQLAFVTLFLIGFFCISFTTMVNTTIQLNSADDMRGRVMSVYTLVFGGVIPIGSLFTGQVTEYAGASGCMIISGIIGILASAYTVFIMRNHRQASGE
jgi:predicted MFS family arabinose efflux permease